MWRYSGAENKPESAKPSLQMKKDKEEEDKFKHIAMHLTNDPSGNAVRPSRVRLGPLRDLFVLSIRLGWNFAIAATVPRSSSSLIWRMKKNNNANNTNSSNNKVNVLGGGRIKRGIQLNANNRV